MSYRFPMRRALAATALLLSAPLTAQMPPSGAGGGGAAADDDAGAAALPYAYHADLVLAAPVIVVATVRSATRIKGAEAAGVAPGFVRSYVEGDVTALIRGAGGLAPRIGWLVDMPVGPDGKPPKLRKAQVMLFGRAAPGTTGSGQGGQLQLVADDGQIDWTPALDALVRRIARAAVAPDAPPAITGVGRAFHVPGSLPGESETQVFLTTADARPVSLSILRRPGERATYAVALSEIVDEAAAPPARGTLLWYRLACFLPRALPAASLGTMEAGDADAAQADYRFVLAQLGPCGPRARVGREVTISTGGGDAAPSGGDAPLNGGDAPG